MNKGANQKIYKGANQKIYKGANQKIYKGAYQKIYKGANQKVRVHRRALIGFIMTRLLISPSSILVTSLVWGEI